MRKIIFIAFVFLSIQSFADSPLGLKRWRTGTTKNGNYYFWSDVSIGSGSGNLSKTSMSGLFDGDRLVIAPGSYGTLASTSLTGITWVSASSRVTLTGKTTVTGCTRTTFSTLTYNSVSGIAMQYVGHNEGGGLDHISFRNVSGDCINSDITRAAYNGTTASLSMYLMTFDSITCYNSGKLHYLNAGDISNSGGWSDSLVYTRIRIDQQNNNGEGIRGIGFRLKFDQALVTYSGTNPSGGDVGILTIFGQIYVSNVVSDGCAGYIYRVYGTTLIANPRDNYAWNNLKINGTRYGRESNRNDPTMYGTYTQGNNHFIWNCGIINSHDDGGYISKGHVLGAHSGFIFHMHNTYAINVTGTGGNILQNDSGSGSGLDTSNNSQFATNTTQVDGTTYVPSATSIYRNGGTSKAWMTSFTTDLAGHSFEATRPIGPLSFSQITPCNGCVLFKRITKGKQG